MDEIIIRKVWGATHGNAKLVTIPKKCEWIKVGTYVRIIPIFLSPHKTAREEQFQSDESNWRHTKPCPKCQSKETSENKKYFSCNNCGFSYEK